MLERNIVVHDFVIRNRIGRGLVIQNERIAFDVGFGAFGVAAKGSQSAVGYFTAMLAESIWIRLLTLYQVPGESFLLLHPDAGLCRLQRWKEPSL